MDRLTVGAAGLLAALTALALLAGCLPDIPSHTLAGTLVVSPERLEVLAWSQEQPPDDGPEWARYQATMTCRDGERRVSERFFLNEDGSGPFEIVVPSEGPDDDARWTCAFSARGLVALQGDDGRVDYPTPFALGTILAGDDGCEGDGPQGPLFAWSGESQWLGELVADGDRACPADDPSGSPLPATTEPPVFETFVRCGVVNVTEAIGPSSADKVGWSPILCYRLLDSAAEGLLAQIGLYLGLDTPQVTGCPMVAPVLMRIDTQQDGALAFASFESELLGINAAGVIFPGDGVGPQALLRLQGRNGFDANIGQDVGLPRDGPGGWVMETSGPMAAYAGMPDIFFGADPLACEALRDGE